MPDSGRIVCIAGAGIAGMTLALALAKFGARVLLLEREPSIQEFGAGLQISPNARRVLNRLGLDRPISASGFEPAGIDVYTGRGEKRLITLSLGETVRRRYGVPYAVMHRQDLAEALHRACKRFANIDITFGVRRFDAEWHGKGVSVLIDEPDLKARSVRAFALVGADGVNSLTRTAVLGMPAAAATGLIAWRVLLRTDEVEGLLATDRTSLIFGPGWHLVAYPLPHRRRINVALFLKDKLKSGAQPPKNPVFPRHNRPGKRVARLMELAEDTWGRWPLNLVLLPSWHEGGVGLIGDAAHAMLPFQAQGAAMAIEDAALLAPLLMTEPDAASAFARFERLRRPRVERVVRVSRANGLIYDLEWPFTLGRDLAIGLGGPSGHLKRLDWIYGYDAAPEIEAEAMQRIA